MPAFMMIMLRNGLCKSITSFFQKKKKKYKKTHQPTRRERVLTLLGHENLIHSLAMPKHENEKKQHTHTTRKNRQHHRHQSAVIAKSSRCLLRKLLLGYIILNFLSFIWFLLVCFLFFTRSLTLTPTHTERCYEGIYFFCFFFIRELQNFRLA
jgi:hypothetical protein